MKTIIIGDIHGCGAALWELLQKLKPDPVSDRLVVLGDMFESGPDSWTVFQMVKTLQADFGDHFVLLRGNHEDYLLTPRLSFPMRLMWDRVGRGATMQSFKEHGQKMEDTIPWVEEHAVLYYKGEGFWCVHAGMRIDPPELNDMQTLIHDHDIVLENRYAGPLTITGHIALPRATHFAGDGETVRELEEEIWYPLPENGIICIDTGCGKGGRLTAMVIEDDRFILYGFPES